MPLNEISQQDSPTATAANCWWARLVLQQNCNLKTEQSLQPLLTNKCDIFLSTFSHPMGLL